MSPAPKDIAVIGMAGRFPKAHNINEFWVNLERGLDAVTEVTRWDMVHRFSTPTPKPGKTYCKWGAFLEDIDRFDPLFFNISPKQAQGMDPRQRLMLEVAWETLEHAGYAGGRLSETKTGVFIGASDNQYLFLDRRMEDHPDGLDNSSGAIANRISHFLNLFGPSMTLDTTCSSSLMAIHVACQSIRQGESETAIAGGIHLILLPDYYITMSQMKLLSPDPIHRVMDRKANGFVPGEGVCAVLLKPLNRAKEDNDTIYAVIKGSAANFSGKTDHMSVPNPDALKEVIRQAMEQSGIDPETVSYVELNGAGTLLGDFAEMQALTAVFKGSHGESKDCLIGSVKTNIGNLEAASGIAGFIKVLLSMNHHKIPPSLHFEKGNRFINWEKTPFSVCTQIRDWPHDRYLHRAGVSSFGVGGTNVHLIAEAHDARSRRSFTGASGYPAASEQVPVIITLSAHALQILPALAENLKKRVGSEMDLQDLSYTLNTGRAHLRYRIALIAASLDDLLKKLDFIIRNPNGPSYGSDSGIFFSGADAGPAENDPYRRRHPLAQIIGFQKKSGSQPEEPTSIGIDTLPEDLRDYMEFLASMAAEYVKGRAVEWNRLYKRMPRRKLALPSYPFERRICWIQPDTPFPGDKKTDMTPAAGPPDIRTSVQPMYSGLSEQEIFDGISRIIIDHMVVTMGYSESEINLDTPLADYGIDSIRHAALLERIAHETGKKTDSNHRFDLSTISDIARFYAQEPSVGDKSPPAVSLSRRVLSGSTDVAVIGMACRFPGANNIDMFWKNLQNGMDAVTEIPGSRFDVNRYYNPDQRQPGKMCTKWGAFIDDFDCFDAVFFNIHKKAAQRMDPQHRLFLEQVWTAFEHAGYTKKDLKSVSTGVFAGLSAQEYTWQILKENQSLTHYDGLGTARALLANRISHHFGLTGPSMTVDTACASSLTALHLACRSLIRGECDLAVAGGANLAFAPDSFVIFSKAGVLSKTGRCRVFDEKADGYVRGEGVGVVIVKRLEDALSAGDTVLAVIKGSAINHNGENFSITSPSLKSQIELFEKAYHEAGIHPETLTYLEAGSTGTYRGDPIEIRALSEVFGRYTSRRGFCAVGSTKTHVGHLEACSGMAALVRVICSMREKKIPPMLHFSKINDAIQLEGSPFFINRTLIDWEGGTTPRRAGITNFGFGGTNLHFIIEESPSTKPMHRNQPEHTPQVCSLSAKTRQALKTSAGNLKTHLDSNPDLSLGDVCYTLNRGRNQFKEYRIAKAVGSRKDLSAWLSRLEIPEEKIRPANIAIAFGEVEAIGSVAKHLFTHEPLFRDAVLSSDRMLEKILGNSCVERLLSRPADTARLADDSRHRLTALALQYSTAVLLTAWGIRPNMMIGDRWNQIAAACAAEALTLESGFRLIDMLSGAESPIGKSSVSDPERFEKRLGEISVKRPKCRLYRTVDDADLSPFFDAVYRRTGADDGNQLRDALASGDWIVLEIGRNDLTTPLMPGGVAEFRIESKPFLLENTAPEDAVQRLLADLCRAGADINWAAVYRHREGKRIPLPTYPFQKHRFWVPS